MILLGTAWKAASFITPVQCPSNRRRYGPGLAPHIQNLSLIILIHFNQGTITSKPARSLGTDTAPGVQIRFHTVSILSQGIHIGVDRHQTTVTPGDHSIEGTQISFGNPLQGIGPCGGHRIPGLIRKRNILSNTLCSFQVSSPARLSARAMIAPCSAVNRPRKTQQPSSSIYQSSLRWQRSSFSCSNISMRSTRRYCRTRRSTWEAVPCRAIISR